MFDTAVPNTVYVVDDQLEILEMMETLLTSVSIPVLTFQSGPAFLAYLQDHRDDAHGCLLVDMLMPKMNGIEVMAQLKKWDIQLPTIMMSGHGDVAGAVQAMRLGALDFIQKPFGPQLLINGINEALRLSDELRARRYKRKRIIDNLGNLTEREKEIYKILLQGHDTKEIAAILNISANTVDSHRAHISKKMHADSLSQLIVMGLQVADCI